MTNLGLALSSMQMMRNIQNRKMAKEIGISESTLSKIKKGKMPDVDGFVKIMKWLTAERKGVVLL